MKAQKWNYDRQEYDVYELPKNASMYEEDMTMIISCASCGEPEIFGQSFTSRVIHNRIGLAYSVCVSCHNKEREIEENHRRRNQNEKV